MSSRDSTASLTSTRPLMKYGLITCKTVRLPGCPVVLTALRVMYVTVPVLVVMFTGSGTSVTCARGSEHSQLACARRGLFSYRLGQLPRHCRHTQACAACRASRASEVTSKPVGPLNTMHSSIMERRAQRWPDIPVRTCVVLLTTCAGVVWLDTSVPLTGSPMIVWLVELMVTVAPAAPAGAGASTLLCACSIHSVR